MSQIYVTEPPTNGKVVLRTTQGDLDIELWPKEAPMAVKNFVQLCMEGYYDGTKFHRLIKDFLLQGGDRSGTGRGGDSIYDDIYFKDEYHSRLKFNHRGIVACANQNKPHTNNSQFFITLDKCQYLDRKNTIFGKITGNTIFNLQRMGTLETENDEPIDPPVILSVEILANPFEDKIIPRDIYRVKAQKGDKQEKVIQKKRQTNLMSFADDDDVAQEYDQEDQKVDTIFKSKNNQSQNKRSKIGSQIVQQKPDPNLQVPEPSTQVDKDPKFDKFNSLADRMQQKLASQKSQKDKEVFQDLRQVENNKPTHDTQNQDIGQDIQQPKNKYQEQNNKLENSSQNSDSSSENSDSNESTKEKRGHKNDKNQKVERSSEYRRVQEKDKNKSDLSKRPDMKGVKEVYDGDILNEYWRNIKEQKQKQKQIAGHQDKTMERFQAFQAKLQEQKIANMKKDIQKNELQQIQEKDKMQQEQDKQIQNEEKNKKQILKSENLKGEKDTSQGGEKQIDYNLPSAWRVDNYLGNDEDDDFNFFKGHKITFRTNEKQVRGEDKDDVDNLMILDPLQDIKKKFSKKEQAQLKRQNEWAGKARK